MLSSFSVLFREDNTIKLSFASLTLRVITPAHSHPPSLTHIWFTGMESDKVIQILWVVWGMKSVTEIMHFHGEVG